MRPSDTGQTKLSDKDWRDLILVELKGRGGSRYYSGICPICLITYDVDTSSARTLAVEKVETTYLTGHTVTLRFDGIYYYFFATAGLGEAAGAAATRTAVPVTSESDGLTMTLSDGERP